MRVKLIVSAAGEPEALYAGADGAEAFEFARTASRLYEMRSADYLALPHGRDNGSQAGDLGGIAETFRASSDPSRHCERSEAIRGERRTLHVPSVASSLRSSQRQFDQARRA